MVRSELIKRSPLRVLENSIQGGVGKGNIGVLASRKGVGKTACLVHIATDKLLADKHVIHVSFSARVDHIISWYEDIFKEIAKWKDLEAASSVHEEIIRNRVIMNFNQAGIRTQQVVASLEAMISDGQFPADTVIFDGFDLSMGGAEALDVIKDFAKRTSTEVWFSASLKGEEPLFDENWMPNELKVFLDQIDVLVSLRFEGEHVRLQVVKDHGSASTGDLHLMLDPKTLLIAAE
ncbi:MAG TPA: hypothetical protein VMW69_05980 [Spirochaetia bacterium]|nr:hypothetical protein [Spirochaetia bacterium]